MTEQTMRSPADYQREAHTFAGYGENPTYPFAGLAEEAGEVLGKFAKYIRKHGGAVPIANPSLPPSGYPRLTLTEADVAFREDLKKELGDVCWMVAECATIYGLDLGEIMAANLAKLEDRKRRGVIIGEGDNR
jgi:NTP pyrophosphatase (non-canonical NTP hydrolase)